MVEKTSISCVVKRLNLSLISFFMLSSESRIFAAPSIGSIGLSIKWLKWLKSWFLSVCLLEPLRFHWKMHYLGFLEPLGVSHVLGYVLELSYSDKGVLCWVFPWFLVFLLLFYRDLS